MATAQQLVAGPVHDNSCVKEEEKNHETIQETPCTEVGDRASHAKVHDDGGCTEEEGEDELQAPATDTDDGQRIAQEIEANLAIQPAEAEAKEPKEGRLGRGAKRTTENAAAKGVVVPVDDGEVAAPEAGKKKAEKAAAKWAVVPVDDETDAEAVAPAVDQVPVAAPVAPEEVAGEEATKGGEEDARDEKAHEE